MLSILQRASAVGSPSIEHHQQQQFQPQPSPSPSLLLPTTVLNASPHHPDSIPQQQQQQQLLAKKEINIRRMLNRCQAFFTKGEVEEEDRDRIKHLLDAIGKEIEELNEEGEEETKTAYRTKLAFMVELERASRGDRPAVSGSTHHVMNSTAVVNDSIGDVGIHDMVEKRRAITFEESKMRKALLNETELRKRLGMTVVKSTMPTGTATATSQVELDKALESGRRLRDAILDEVLDLTGNLKEMSEQANRNLHHDVGRVEVVNDMVSNNLSNARGQIGRMQTLIASSSSSCRKTCALVTFVLCVWIAMYVFMKIIPSPRRVSA